MKIDLCKFDTISDSLNMAPLPTSTSIESTYDIVRESGQKGKMNNHYGIKHSAATISKMSNLAKARWANVPYPRVGKRHSDETKKIMSDRAKGRPSPRRGCVPWNKGLSQTDDVKQAISAALKGRPRSEEARKALSQGALQRIKIQCIHCGMVADASNIGRWHNDNCKSKMGI